MEVWGEGGKSPRETAPLRCQVGLKCTVAEVHGEGGWGPSTGMNEQMSERRHRTVVKLSLLLGLPILLFIHTSFWVFLTIYQ